MGHQLDNEILFHLIHLIVARRRHAAAGFYRLPNLGEDARGGELRLVLVISVLREFLDLPASEHASGMHACYDSSKYGR